MGWGGETARKAQLRSKSDELLASANSLFRLEAADGEAQLDAGPVAPPNTAARMMNRGSGTPG